MINKDWVIIATPHDKEGADRLYELLRVFEPREFMLGDTMRSFYAANGLNSLKSAAWHCGHYVGLVADVEKLLAYVNSLDPDQLEMMLG